MNNDDDNNCIKRTVNIIIVGIKGLKNTTEYLVTKWLFAHLFLSPFFWKMTNTLQGGSREYKTTKLLSLKKKI